jgi:hypothetical protein
VGLLTGTVQLAQVVQVDLAVVVQEQDNWEAHQLKQHQQVQQHTVILVEQVVAVVAVMGLDQVVAEAEPAALVPQQVVALPVTVVLELI